MPRIWDEGPGAHIKQEEPCRALTVGLNRSGGKDNCLGDSDYCWRRRYSYRRLGSRESLIIASSARHGQRGLATTYSHTSDSNHRC